MHVQGILIGRVTGYSIFKFQAIDFYRRIQRRGSYVTIMPASFAFRRNA